MDRDYLKGRVDTATFRDKELTVSGWAVDIHSGQPPAAIWVYVDGKLVHVGKTSRPRPEVNARLNLPSLQDPGFWLAFTLEEPPEVEVRVYAVSRAGFASELKIKDYQWRPKP
jgi:hypothetical protein